MTDTATDEMAAVLEEVVTSRTKRVSTPSEPNRLRGGHAKEMLYTHECRRT